MSADYTNDTRSGIVDGPSTMVVDDRMVKVLVWYDNEYGYVFRMAELAAKVAASLAAEPDREAPQLHAGHRRLLGVHAHRRCAADAGAAALQRARLLAGGDRVPVPRLRVHGDPHQPARRLGRRRRGLNRTLVAGLGLQVVALVALTFDSPAGRSGPSWRS